MSTPDESTLRRRLGLPPIGYTIPAQLRIQGWAVTVLAGLIAAVTRLVGLRLPHELVFDETYYVKGAYSLLNFGYERKWEGENQDQLFVSGDLSALRDAPSYWVHPPLGKWLMAGGMQLLGDSNGLGWRFTTAALGVATVMLVVRIGLALFHSVPLAGFAGLAVALDGVGITLSRTALLDAILAFFVLAGFWAVLRDREYARAKLARQLTSAEIPRALGLRGAIRSSLDPRTSPNASRTLGPHLGWRPWLFLAGILLGASCGVKWSGAFAIAVFGILVYAWGTAARRAVGLRPWFLAGIVREGIPAFFQLVPTALAAYLAAWIPWFANPNGWGRQWAAQQRAANASLPAADRIPLPLDSAPDVVNSFIHYHQETLAFHTGLSTPHTYQSLPWQWLAQLRPVSFYWKGELPDSSCWDAPCVAAITSVGNPAVWWLGLVALAMVIWAALRHRDWRAFAILAGYAAMYLPWYLYLDRTIFQFYSVAFLPYVALALAFGVGWITGIIGPPGSRRVLNDDARLPRAAILIVCTAIVAAAIFWMPLWTGSPVPRWFWQIHMWLPSWI